MSIKFKSVEYKNFLSCGNKPIKIDFTATPSTLIVGTNGCGKCLRGNTTAEIMCKSNETFNKLQKFLAKRASVKH